MRLVQLVQGSPEWHAHRRNHFNASDASAMMGVSPYKTRAELLREMAAGVTADVDSAVQRRFDDGHRFEALARPMAEVIIDDTLYPAVGIDGKFSASFDGITLGNETIYEHKTLNAELAAIMGPNTRGADLPLHYRVQMEHQMMVSGATAALFVASKWDADGKLIALKHCYYSADPELRAQIIAGWAQFEKDLAAYVPPSAPAPEVSGRAPETLPALRIEVTGAVTASNLAEFKATALDAIRSVNRELRTDQDFADAEKAVKWCAEVESRLKAAKEHALSQTADIDALFKALDDISAEARAVRLDLDKLVKRRKDEVREQAVMAARRALDAHITPLNAELAPFHLQPVQVDFAAAIKGLRSIASMQDALDTALASGKIHADAQARVIRGNLATFKAKASGFEALFADLHMLVHKAADDFAAVVDARIARRQADEAAREAKRQAEEAERIAMAEAAAREQEAARMAAAASQHVAAPSPTAVQSAQVFEHQPQRNVVAAHIPAQHVRQAANDPATLKLGAICERLGFTVTDAFLSDVLHVAPAATDKAAKLYRESDWPVICAQIVAHVAAMGELYRKEAA